LHDAIHVKAGQPVNIDTIKDTLPVFESLPLGEFTEDSSLTSPEYKPDSWIALRNVRENFSPEPRGLGGLEHWIFFWLKINADEAYETHSTVSKACIVQCNYFDIVNIEISI
jgi:hypothetical protein